MRLCEIHAPKMYLFTRNTHALGTKLRPARGSALLGATIEGWLEKHRPQGRLSRSGSIFLQTADETPEANLIAYEVAPLGKLERCHCGWLRLLQQPGADQPLMDQWVSNYRGC